MQYDSNQYTIICKVVNDSPEMRIGTAAQRRFDARIPDRKQLAVGGEV